MMDILRLSLPISIWITGFSAIYALHGLTCSRHWPEMLAGRSVLLAAGAVAVMVQVLCLVAILKFASPSRLVQFAATAIAAAVVAAAVWTALPVLLASTCL